MESTKTQGRHAQDHAAGKPQPKGAHAPQPNTSLAHGPQPIAKRQFEHLPEVQRIRAAGRAARQEISRTAAHGARLVKAAAGGNPSAHHGHGHHRQQRAPESHGQR